MGIYYQGRELYKSKKELEYKNEQYENRHYKADTTDTPKSLYKQSLAAVNAEWENFVFWNKNLAEEIVNEYAYANKK